MIRQFFLSLIGISGDKPEFLAGMEAKFRQACDQGALIPIKFSLCAKAEKLEIRVEFQSRDRSGIQVQNRDQSEFQSWARCEIQL